MEKFMMIFSIICHYLGIVSIGGYAALIAQYGANFYTVGGIITGLLLAAVTIKIRKVGKHNEN